MANLTLLDLSEAKEKYAAGRGGLTLNNPEQWADFLQLGLKTAAGKLVTRETAMRVSGVLACLRILMEDLSSPPLVLKRRTPRGTEEATEHPLYNLLRNAPNYLQTSMEVREHIIMDLILTGRFACWQQRDSKGAIAAIYPLHASRLFYMRQSANGDLNWNYSSPELTRDFTQADLWRGNTMAQYIIDGRALILLAREAIGLAMAAEEQGARLFSNGIQTNFTLSTPDSLDDNSRNNLINSLNESNAGSAKSWKPLLLENGLTATKIGLTAQESQYLEARKFQLEDIARIFRIPDVLLGISSGKSSTYASAEQFFASYARHTLGPWFTKIEQTISRDLLLPSEQSLFAKHDLTSLLRADQKTRYESYVMGINGGFMSRNQVRIAEDWTTEDGLDEFLTPLNMGESMQEPVTPTTPTKVDPQDEADGPDESGTGRKLALRAANAIIKSEIRQFSRKRVSASSADNFSAWHLERVMELTGASTEDAANYSDWRLDASHDNPLAESIEKEARERLVNLCLGVSCDK